MILQRWDLFFYYNVDQREGVCVISYNIIRNFNENIVPNNVTLISIDRNLLSIPIHALHVSKQNAAFVRYDSGFFSERKYHNPMW